MALAIRFDQLIRDGEVADQAELARVGYVSRARLTQIMNLLNLAPDIQEEILYLPAVESGPDPVTERHLRPIAAVANWGRQRGMWRSVAGRCRNPRTGDRPAHGISHLTFRRCVPPRVKPSSRPTAERVSMIKA
jgi:hypothetical protein